MSEETRATLLEARGVSLGEETAAFDFTLSAGEIVGLSGLDGHGQADFLKVLAGWRRPARGSVSVAQDGGLVPLGDAWSAFDHDVVYLPQDRKNEGIFPSLSILDNFRTLTLGRASRWGFISGRQAKAAFARHRERLDIVLSSPSAPITSLSGGNQQKVLLARLLEAEPRVMLLDDPTRGVDHPTRLALYAEFERLASSSGIGIVVLSTEMDEIIQHCHRALVFRTGAPVAELDRDELSRDAILAGMFGVQDDESEA